MCLHKKGDVGEEVVG